MSHQIDDNLVGGERIAYRGHVHPIKYTKAVLVAALAIGVFALTPLLPIRHEITVTAGWAIAAVAAVFGWWAHVRISTSEFAVTDRRVIMHVGWLRKTSQELFLGKVEGVSINQTFVGRIFNFGDISIRGGGIQEDLSTIAAPYRFRQSIEILAGSQSRG